MAFDNEEELGNMSLDGRSLIVPDYGDVDDMSSLGTNSKLTYQNDSPYVKYIGDKKVVERPYDVARMSSLEKKIESYHADPENPSPDYGVDIYDNSLPAARKDTELSQSFEKDDDKKEEKKSRCLPQWLSKAPLWLKIIIIASVALLIGASVLIVAGAVLAKGETVSSSSAEESGKPKTPTLTFPSSRPTSPPFAASGNVPIVEDPIDEAPVVALTDVPTGFPTTSTPTVAQTNSPTTSPITSAPTIHPTDSPTTEEPTVAPTTAEPTRAPTTSPTDTPTLPATKSPTPSPTHEMINFYVMGGRFDEEERDTLVTGLELLPKFDGNTILVHLGDWNSPYTTLCSEDSFTSNAESYQRSSVPVYFVPGDNEYNDCPNPEQALDFWNQYFLNFETKYWNDSSWEVKRQFPEYGENFAFLQREVLFVGINLVGGIVHDQEEWDARHAANLLWIERTAANYGGSYDTMVVFAHSDPNIQINQNFFQDFFPMVESFDEKVILMHRNLGIATWNLESKYNGIKNLDVISVEGSKWPPMWVQIDPSDGTFGIDQSDWYDQYIAKGKLPKNP